MINEGEFKKRLRKVTQEFVGYLQDSTILDVDGNFPPITYQSGWNNMVG